MSAGENRPAISGERRLMLWLLVGAAFAGLLYLLREALLPFVAGMGVAYLLDPVADRMEKLKCPRAVAALIIVASFLAAAIAVAVVLVPILSAQLAELIGRLPGYLQHLRELADPVIANVRAQLTEEQLAQLGEAFRGYAGDAVGWLGQALKGVLTGGLAILNVLSLILIMPLVAFYLIRDWDEIVAYIDGLLPRDGADTIRGLVGEIDDRLSGFVRGQATVCLALGAWNAVGLTLVGLDFGLLVGLGAGLISFIPYVGTAVGLAAGLGIAVAQFDTWLPIALVGAVFASSQIIEGFVLTPNLVGDRVGLHPAWVLFALMAGGALLGFTGVLLAIPVAAVIGVLVRFATERYRASGLYTHRADPPTGAAEVSADIAGDLSAAAPAEVQGTPSAP